MRQPEHPTFQNRSFMHWFDNASPAERERFREDEEKYWAAIDMYVYQVTFGEPHPNEGMEYEPLVQIKTLRTNYMR